ncbi:MAG: glycine oxidase ThiO [Acidobacteriota bacterium]
MTSDVLVIGGGIIGGTIAWRLAQAGAAVELLEAGTWGNEASWAGAGMLAPGGEMERAGAGAQLALQGRAQYADYVRELCGSTGRQIDYRECGAVELALGEGEQGVLQARMNVQRQFGISSEWLNPGQLRTVVPSLSSAPWAGAAWYADDAVVNPRELMQALRVACESRGVRVREGTAVSELTCNGSRVEARTMAGDTYTAESAVLAAGAWSSHIKLTGAPSLVKSLPVRGHLLQFAMPRGWLRPIVRHGHTYLFQRTNGSLIAGATTERVDFRREIDNACVREIHERAAQLLPDLAAIEPVEAWNGIRPASAQTDPVVGRVGRSRLWTAYGHYRNGILMAPSTARVVTAEITSSWGTS